MVKEQFLRSTRLVIENLILRLIRSLEFSAEKKVAALLPNGACDDRGDMIHAGLSSASWNCNAQ